MEIDVPAATILNIFGLRAQVRVLSPYLCLFLAPFIDLIVLSVNRAVVLVAEHCPSGYFLRIVHRAHLAAPAFLRARETVKSEG